jgi:hypothetical protein
MSFDRFAAEQAALRGLLELIEKANQCRVMYERAGMALPEPLQRFLGVAASDGPTQPGQPTISIPPLERYPHPGEWAPGWIWIDIAGATPTSLVLALLREADKPVRAPEVAEHVTTLMPSVPAGTVFNLGKRLAGSVIRRTRDGWELTAPEQAPLLFDGLLWGPAKVFVKSELASHRREALMHILNTAPGGLQASQLTEYAKSCQWIYAPVSKELIQDDLELLFNQSKVRRRGNSRKWELAQGSKEEA